MPNEDKSRRRMIVEEIHEPSVNVEVNINPPPVEAPVEDTPNVVVVNKVENEVENTPQQEVPEAPKEEVSEALEQVTEEKEEKVEEKEVTPEETKESTPKEPEMNSAYSEVKPTLKSSNNLSPFIILVPGILLLGALLGGIYFYQKNVNQITGGDELVPVQSLTPSVAPTASPVAASASANLTKYPINVLNGSGIVGEAGKVKSLLETGGFKVAGTGNASSYNYSKTVIKAKADVPAEVLDKLEKTLEKSYLLDETAVLGLSSPDTIQVIVGSSKVK